MRLFGIVCVGIFTLPANESTGGVEIFVGTLNASVVSPIPSITATSGGIPGGTLYTNSTTGTSFDLIHTDDPDYTADVVYLGWLVRAFPGAGNISCHVFEVSFTDTTNTIELRMGGTNPIDSSTYANTSPGLTAAWADVDKHVLRIGKLPVIYRRNIAYIIGYAGNGTDSPTENLDSDDDDHYFILYADRADTLIAGGNYEEAVFHVATHASIQTHGTNDDLTLDDYSVLADSAWQAAVAADNDYITDYAETSVQADLAEHALFAFAMLLYPTRIPEPDRTWIAAKIPHRIAYFEDLFLPATPVGPLYPNSIASVDFDLIHSDDPDHSSTLTYLGVQTQNIERQGPDHNQTLPTSVWVWELEYDDTPKTTLIYMGGVCPYDGSGGATYANQAAALVDVLRYVPRLGKLPPVFRRNIHHMEGLAPNGSDANEVTNSDATPHYMTFCSDRMTVRENNNDMEETFFHESVHASIQTLGNGPSLGNLDTYSVLADPNWQAAVAADNDYITEYAMTGTNEDLAEHALFAFTILYNPERLPQPDRTWIANKIPNRIAYLQDIFEMTGGGGPPPGGGGAVAHRASAAANSTTATTSLTVTIPASTVADDVIFLATANRGATTNPTVSDNDSGGNNWALVGGTNNTGSGDVFWKRATSGTASKTITVSGCTDSCSAVLSVFSGALVSGTPYATVSAQANPSVDKSHNNFSTTIDDAMVCLAVINLAGANATSSQTGLVMGALAQQIQHLNTGGSDCATSIACAVKASVGETGDISWSQTNGITVSVAWTILPEPE